MGKTLEMIESQLQTCPKFQWEGFNDTRCGKFHDIESEELVVDLFQIVDYRLDDEFKATTQPSTIDLLYCTNLLPELPEQEQGEELTKICNQFIAEETHQQAAAKRPRVELDDIPEGIPLKEKQQQQQTTTKRPRLEQLDDLPERLLLKDMNNTREKMELMRKLWNQKQARGHSNMTNKANVFVSTCLRPILRCLEHHFDGDVDKFCEKYPRLAPSTFVKNCCCGDPDSAICTPKSKSDTL